MQLEQIRPQLEAQHAQVVAISVDAADESAKLAQELGLQFPLLSDMDLHVITAYGVAMDGRDIAVPATFIVRKDRSVAWKRVGEEMTDRPSPADILAQVRAAAAAKK